MWDYDDTAAVDTVDHDEDEAGDKWLLFIRLDEMKPEYFS